MSAIKTEKDLPENLRQAWLKAMSAFELRNYGYTLQLLQPVMKEAPAFLAARQLARKAAVAKNAGKKSFLSGLSGASFSLMKAQGLLKKDPLATMEAVEKILENEPHNVQANQLLRDAAKAANLPQVAIFAMETIVEANPKDTKTLHELAKFHMELDDPEKALETFNRILAINPHDLIAVKGSKDAAAAASMKSGGWETAESYRDLIKDKETAVKLEQQSRVVRDEDMVENLLQEQHKLIEQNPQNVDVARRIGELYEQKEDLENARQWYEYASSLLKGSDPNINRKISQITLKQIDLCIKAREEYVAQNPGTPEAAQYETELADLKKQRAEFEITDAKARVDRNPTDLQARYEYGEILVRAGRHQEAIPELQKARQNPNTRLRAMNLLAQCYSAKNMLDLAAKTLSDAASELSQMDNTKKDVLYNLGIVYERMGKKEEMIECMKQIYDVDYGYRDVAQRVESSYA